MLMPFSCLFYLLLPSSIFQITGQFNCRLLDLLLLELCAYVRIKIKIYRGGSIDFDPHMWVLVDPLLASLFTRTSRSLEGLSHLKY